MLNIEKQTQSRMSQEAVMREFKVSEPSAPIATRDIIGIAMGENSAAIERLHDAVLELSGRLAPVLVGNAGSVSSNAEKEESRQPLLANDLHQQTRTVCDIESTVRGLLDRLAI